MKIKLFFAKDIAGTVDGIKRVALTTDHAASSYGQPVAVTEDGEAIDQLSWQFAEVIEATAAELQAFRAAGYEPTLHENCRIVTA